jgi:hypothetical protein
VRFIAEILIVIVIAALGGVGLTYFAAERAPGLVGNRIGAWVALPSIAAQNADPYALAALAAQTELSLSVDDGVAFRAETDDDQQPLSGRCDYLVEGSVPAARVWTLAAYDHAGQVFPNQADRFAFSSGEVVRDANGTIRIALSAKARPGNWLPLGAGQPFVLFLRLYDTAAGALMARRSLDMPHIRRVRC